MPLVEDLIGARVHTQYVVFDPQANAAGLAFTRGVTTTLGGQR